MSSYDENEKQSIRKRSHVSCQHNLENDLTRSLDVLEISVYLNEVIANIYHVYRTTKNVCISSALTPWTV